MWQQFAIALIMSVISYAIQASNMPKPRAPQQRRFESPISEDGNVPPVVFGTILIKKLNVIDSRNQTVKSFS